MGVTNVDQTDFLAVDELIDTQPGKPFSKDGVRTYTRRFKVVTNDRELGSSYVCGADGIPRPFSVYQTADGREFDLYALLVDYDVSRKEQDGHYHWIVTCNYSTEVPEDGVPADAEIGREPAGWHNEPWNRPAVIKWDWEETTWSPPADLDGRPFCNSARQPFSPPPTFPIARLVLVVEQNELHYDAQTAAMYAYAVNTKNFLHAAPGCAQCLPIRSERRNLGPVPYFKNTYRIRFNLPKLLDAVPDVPMIVLGFSFGDRVVEDIWNGLQSFQPMILDQGFCKLQQVTGAPFGNQPVPIFRPGSQTTQALLLDGTGQPAKPNGSGKLAPTYLGFRVFRSMDFTFILTGGVF